MPSHSPIQLVKGFLRKFRSLRQSDPSTTDLDDGALQKRLAILEQAKEDSRREIDCLGQESDQANTRLMVLECWKTKKIEKDEEIDQRLSEVALMQNDVILPALEVCLYPSTENQHSCKLEIVSQTTCS